MRDVIDELLARGDVTVAEPSSCDDIHAVTAQLSAPVTEALDRLWRASDGVMLESLDAHILGPAEVLSLLSGDTGLGLVERGLIPILDDHQSNYLAVFVRGPRASRIAHLPHDDGSRLMFRDFDSCISALIAAASCDEKADSFLYETAGDYPPDAPRSKKDQAAARALLACPHEIDEWDHAAQLLDASNLEEWARLLETDHFVRREVRERMHKMASPAIKELLRKDDAAVAEFIRQAADAARNAGLKVVCCEDGTLQVGRRYMNLDAFFHRRNIPNAMPRMVAWFEDVIAGRDPRARPGHFDSD